MAIGLHIAITAKDAQIIRGHLEEPEWWEDRPARIAFNVLMRRLDVDGGHVIIYPDEARIIRARLRYEWDDLDAHMLWKWKEEMIKFVGRSEAKTIFDEGKARIANG